MVGFELSVSANANGLLSSLALQRRAEPRGRFVFRSIYDDEYVYDVVASLSKPVVRFHVYGFMSSCSMFLLVFSVCIASDDGGILARSCPDVSIVDPDVGGNGPDIGLACPDIELSSPDVIVDGGESHFVGSIRPGNVGWPSRPRPSNMSSYSTNRVAVL